MDDYCSYCHMRVRWTAFSQTHVVHRDDYAVCCWPNEPRFIALRVIR